MRNTAKIKTALKMMTACLILILALSGSTAWAKPGGGKNAEGEKSLSPYFFVKSDDPSLDQLPLKSTRAQVKISGMVARVRIFQTYRNQGNKTLEAIYIFPASTRAAVHGLRMTIGERVIQAKIEERQKARQEYQAAKKQGRSASLLEQQRPNVFQMNVANILPGDVIKVELTYTEILIPEDGIYQFVFPTVVGPRYAGQDEDQAAESWVKNPYLPQGRPAAHTFGLNLSLLSPLPVSKVSCPSHQARITYPDPKQVRVSLADDSANANRDFVLRYQLAGKRIQSGLWLYEGQKENYFLLMLEPPQAVPAKEVLPREYIFVVDVSGSMNGFPLRTAKTLMGNLLAGLGPKDRFNLLLFAGGNALLAESSLPATPENLKRAKFMLDRQRGGGGTRLLPALRRALELPENEDTSRVMVVITDGYVRVEKETFALIRDNLGRANLFSFGIGSSVNRFLIEGMARAGQGEPQIVLNPGQAAGKAAKFRRYISSPVLKGVKASMDGFQAYDLEPEVLPDLFARRPVVLMGKYRGKAAGSITISGRSAQGEFKKTMAIKNGLLSPANQSLRQLWARKRLQRLADFNRVAPSSGLAKEITALGLEYSLLTRFTSFVAIDTLVRAKGEEPVTVRQPLPLPQGVSNLAMGRVYRAMSKPAPTGVSMPTLAAAPGRGDQYNRYARAKKDGQKSSRLKLRVIKAPASYAASQAQKKLERCLTGLAKCLKNTPGLSLAKGAEIRLELVINARGELESATPLKGQAKSAGLMAACLQKTCGSTRFPVPKGGGKLHLIISISLQ